VYTVGLREDKFMAINRVEIKDFLVFKGEFTSYFCPGVNVIIGENGTGKSTLVKSIYYIYNILRSEYFKSNLKAHLPYFTQNKNDISPKLYRGKKGEFILKETKYNQFSLHADLLLHDSHMSSEDNLRLIDIRAIYMPEKDILEHAKGLLTFIEQKQTGFSQIYKDILIAAQDIPTNEQSETQKFICHKITDIIGGDVSWDESDGSFYTVKTNGTRIPFANEASGYKKLGFFGLLVSSGQLEPGAVLFWDEPENSLNPELIPILVDILFELSRNGVQIFIATHSEILASYFAVNRKNGDKVLFTSLYREGEQIKANTSDRFDLLTPNKLTEEPVKLYERKLDRGFSGE